MPRYRSISGARQWSDDDDDNNDFVVAGDNEEEDEAHDASRMARQMGVDARYRNPDKKYGYQHSKKSGANKLLMQGREGWSDDDDDDDVADFIADDSHDDDDDDDNEQSGGGRSSSSSSSSDDDDDDDFEDEDAGAGRRRTSNAQAAAAKAIKKLEKARNERDVHTSPPQPARRLRRLSEGTAAPSPTEELAAPKRKLRRVSDLQEQLEDDSPPTTKKIRKLTRVSDL